MIKDLIQVESKFLNRILELTIENKIRWTKTPDKINITRGTRLVGIGLNHKFVINKDINYICFIEKNITSEDTTWRFIESEDRDKEYFVMNISKLMEVQRS